MLLDFREPLKTVDMPLRKTMRKLGTLKVNTVETTPVVWEDKLLRFEWVRNTLWGADGGVSREVGCYHFVDMETEESLGEFAEDHSFGCCYAEDGKMYVYGPRGGVGGRVIDLLVSSDLKQWEQSTVLVLPDDVNVFNTSVCKGDGKYVMAIEVGGDHPMVGVPFTCIFAESTDLLHWSLMDTMECSYARDRYTACPCLRYVDGLYYMICLEGMPCHRWVPYIVRTRDFREYELGINNPVMWFDPAEDKKLIHPERFTEEEKQKIALAVDCNNSDFDLCDYRGKTVITYSWGNQFGKEFLALAEYDGPSSEFLQSFFA